MKRLELKKEYRIILTETHHLRQLIGADIMAHQETIRRWSINNSPKLTTDFFIDSFKKHANIGNNVDITELVDIETKHLQDN